MRCGPVGGRSSDSLARLHAGMLAISITQPAVSGGLETLLWYVHDTRPLRSRQPRLSQAALLSGACHAVRTAGIPITSLGSVQACDGGLCDGHTGSTCVRPPGKGPRLSQQQHGQRVRVQLAMGGIPRGALCSYRSARCDAMECAVIIDSLAAADGAFIGGVLSRFVLIACSLARPHHRPRSWPSEDTETAHGPPLPFPPIKRQTDTTLPFACAECESEHRTGETKTGVYGSHPSFQARSRLARRSVFWILRIHRS